MCQKCGDLMPVSRMVPVVFATLFVLWSLGGGAEILRPVIERVYPEECYAGATVTIVGSGLVPDSGGAQVTVDKASAQVLFARHDSMVIKLPYTLNEGQTKIRVFNRDEKSKPFLISVITLNTPKIIRFMLGGLAFLLLGVFTLTAGLRKYTDRRIRRIIDVMVRNPWLAFLTGALLSSVSQSSTSAGLLLLGIADAGIITLSKCLWVLVGANIGSTITAFFLQFGIAKHAILIIAAGEALTVVSRGRRYKWFLPDLVLGAGFLFYGVHILENGFTPLEGHPAVIDFFSAYSAATPTGFALCFIAGALLVMALQSSGAATVLLVGIAQTTRLFDLPSCVAVLMGVNFGVPLVPLLVARFGEVTGKRTACGHFLINTWGSVVALAAFPFLPGLVDALVPGSPYLIDPDKKIIYPLIGLHVSVAFLALNLLSALTALPFLRLLERLAVKWYPHEQSKTEKELESVGVRDQGATLQKIAEKIRDMSLIDQRLLHRLEQMLSAGPEAGLREMEALLTSMGDLHGAVVAKISGLMKISGYSVNVLKLEQSMYTVVELYKISSLAHRALTSVLTLDRHNVTLTGELEKQVKDLSGKIIGFMEDLGAVLDDPAYLTKAEIRYREIAINRAEERTKALLIEAIGKAAYTPETGQHLLQLISTYEQIGNHVYRIFDFCLLQADNVR